jgi:hypothetical protein
MRFNYEVALRKKRREFIVVTGNAHKTSRYGVLTLFNPTSTYVKYKASVPTSQKTEAVQITKNSLQI